MKKKTGPLTDGEIKTLANKLRGTKWNVFNLIEMSFPGRDLQIKGDEVFRKIERVGQVFKCEMCDEWQDTGSLVEDENYDDDVRVCCACYGTEKE